MGFEVGIAWSESAKTIASSTREGTESEFESPCGGSASTDKAGASGVRSTAKSEPTRAQWEQAQQDGTRALVIAICVTKDVARYEISPGRVMHRQSVSAM